MVVPEDFVLHLPLRYEDETRVTPVSSLRPGFAAQVEGEILRSEVLYRPRRQLTAVLADDSGELQLRWLNFYPSQQKQLTVGRRLRARGEVRGGLFGREMVHPRMSSADQPLPASLTPVYPSTDGLPQPTLRKAIGQALARADLSDTLPEEARRRYGLAEFAPAVRLLHAPPPDAAEHELMERIHPAWRRIKFDELLAQQLSLAAARAARRVKRAEPLPASQDEDGLVARLYEALPFALTGAQQRVVAEIAADLAQPYPMHRLLQGDVGSGKTVVAAIAAAQAIACGAQVALMAPTEILAEQHFRKLVGWLEPLGVAVAWLSGSLSAKARREAAAAVADGSVQLVVGTQALIQDHVMFQRLGLSIVDEQHRFGVGQRLALSRKGETGRGVIVPHQLNMSATPIPRTLAMTFFADLDVSVIDELPPGRTPVVTKLVADARREEVIGHIAHAARQGRQAYWVCPLVEESEALELQTAVDTHEAMRAALPDLRIGLVHGRLPQAEKAEVMRAFREGEIDLLVATTVIEVGVDVPNASLMVIEHAERFGLAQLHQLRGRVGRGTAESICVLLYQAPLSQVARQRLRAMFETSDGFEIARRDLEQRGPGEFLGTRQSGLALLRFADLEADVAIAEQAREAAVWLRAKHPEAVAAHLARWMRGREDFLRT
ncbi:ATP-dependent DNA helicase RecG [Bordetella bronchiseptica]|uniref:ATP-dependent DNA helicase RecG n=1 Tax=Bordetella bronchiseptica (strain ATCC BAA-588 / NCTC 13252 / RB50) TaxID=257310 RepID=A0A0H3LWM2_BORBR|nr:ATP-dependent DNA helicase RecG [Bordetella bronchiseptica]KAK61288.1 ATP-dependent DNA helicase RecG [Bordetella bronchiseptica 980-2]KCV50104.1 ATP-dependent DNA helicase RecG [Bordetella bronchiseptica 3E44]KCV56296.1 ATP-dependent DNA helicase RecG [Bordetella bronchiseptica 980]KDB82511.1 ATP-dependent DNA helicase RecG [Bordetella bronchiseptica D756]KDB93388.1 ATP-dependent DNA helicase RecG [Bordetella bronchiseptica D989]KDC48222.1 ATP-dependent DNA helicase RecG [Bordetella bronc